jgi:hypothetical protein
MHTDKRHPTPRDAMGRIVDWRAKTTVSEKGSVTVSAGEALSSEVVKTQLQAVKRIREASRNKR